MNLVGKGQILNGLLKRLSLYVNPDKLSCLGLVRAKVTYKIYFILLNRLHTNKMAPDVYTFHPLNPDHRISLRNIN